MNAPTTLFKGKGLQWRWIGITFLAYVALYVLPLVVAQYHLLRLSGIISFLVGFWTIAGIVIIAAVAGYISKGITIRERVVASVGLMVVLIVLFVWPQKTIGRRIFASLEPVIIISFLSFVGAWLGERAQKLRKKTPEEETKSALIAAGQKGLTRSGMILGIIGTFVTLLVIIAVGVSLFRAQSVVSNKDALINDLNNLAAFSYQYRIRPTSMEGGNGAYTGLTMPEQLGTNENGTFTFTVIGPDEVKIKAVSKQVEGAAIETTLDGDGRLGNWTYFGKFM